MMDGFRKLISGILALGVYFSIIGLLIFYFNNREENKSIHYVKKDEHRIQVALSSSKKQKQTRKESQAKQSKEEKKAKQSKEEKKAKQSKQEKKSEQSKQEKKAKQNKQPIEKKTKTAKRTKKKASELFANIKTRKVKNTIEMTSKSTESKVKKNIIKISTKLPSASERINSSLKQQKSSDSGVENKYFAKVQRMLEEWPAQSAYAGEKAKVILHIKPSGEFEFKVVTASGNEDFNYDLIVFLEQLQSIGFGRHKGQRTYVFEAEFIAKE